MKRINPIPVLIVVTIILIIILAAALTVITNDRAEAVSGNDCVPSAAWTETVEVEDSPAYSQVEFDHWQRYSWTGGPHAEDDAPAFPSDDWQPNVQGDPHGVGAPGAYYRSHGGSGNGDWFYLEMVMHIVEYPAVTHTETIEHPEVTCPTDPTPTDDPFPTDEPSDPVDEHTPEIIDAPVKRNHDKPVSDALPETGA